MAIKPMNAIKSGFSLTRFLRIGLFVFFILYLIISTTLIAIDKKDVGYAVENLGKEILSPLETATNISLEIQENPPSGFFDSVWTYWGFYFNLYKLFIWVWALYLVVSFLFSGTTSPIMRVGMALFLFYTIQIVYTTVFLGYEINYVFLATGEIFKGIMSIIYSLVETF